MLAFECREETGLLPKERCGRRASACGAGDAGHEGSVASTSACSNAHNFTSPTTLPRYSALKSLGEKKACFNEYLQQRRNQEKEEERKRLKQAREDYAQLLVSCPDFKAAQGFRRATELLEDHPAWKVREGGGKAVGAGCILGSGHARVLGRGIAGSVEVDRT